MDSGSLDTTNLMLAVVAVASLLEVLLLAGLAVSGWKVYRRFTDLANDLEARHVAPAMARVNQVLDDINAVTATVRLETDRVDHAIHRVNDAAGRVRSTVRTKTSGLVGLLRGARVALETLLAQHPSTESTQRT